MSDTIIKAESLCFTYEDGTEALKGIDLEIGRGRKVAFLGANGSGKSTFFFCLNGIIGLYPVSCTLMVNLTIIVNKDCLRSAAK